MDSFDEKFFKEVFHTYYDRIYTGFYRKTRSHEIAQDLSQATFIKFWKYRHGHDFALPVSVQLFRKAKLTLIDWLRKEANERALLEQLSIAPDIRFDAIDSELKDSLDQAISQLPPVRRKVFSMAYIDGLSHKEIAEQLQISVRTVDGHILKALKYLRKILALIYILQHIN